MGFPGILSRLFERSSTYNEARKLAASLTGKGLRLVTAESLTAGKLAASVADIPGASSVLWGGFVCYDTEAKISLLGVNPATIAQHGVVSEETAREMAIGALNRSTADVAISVTGVAGPGRNDGDPSVGTVDLAVCVKLGNGTVETMSKRMHFPGSRNAIRILTVKDALAWVYDCLDRY